MTAINYENETLYERYDSQSMFSLYGIVLVQSPSRIFHMIQIQITEVEGI